MNAGLEASCERLGERALRKGGYAARQDSRDLEKDRRLLQYIRNSEYEYRPYPLHHDQPLRHQIYKCLGDDLRLSLVCLMDVQREICVCDLVDALTPPSRPFPHLAQLRQCELVVARRQGHLDALPPSIPSFRSGHSRVIETG